MNYRKTLMYKRQPAVDCLRTCLSVAVKVPVFQRECWSLIDPKGILDAFFVLELATAGKASWH